MNRRQLHLQRQRLSRFFVRCVTVMAAAPAALHAAEARTPLNPVDLVRLAVIGDPGYLAAGVSFGDLAATSPDGRRMAVVVRRGNPELGTYDAQLLVYTTADLLTQPVPRIVANVSSATMYEPIALVNWLSDNKTLLFAGSHGNRAAQVYSVDVDTLRVTQVTHDARRLMWFDPSADGSRVISFRSQPDRPPVDDPECERGCLITNDNFYWAIRGGVQGAMMVVTDLKTGREQIIKPVQTTHPQMEDCDTDHFQGLAGGLSPDGAFGLIACSFRRPYIPQWWNEYRSAGLSELLKDGSWVRQLMLLDLRTGELQALDGTPYNEYLDGEPAWIEGGRRFILAGAYRSLQNVDGPERVRRTRVREILLVDPHTRESKTIAVLDPKVYRVKAVVWEEPTQILRISSIDSNQAALPVLAYRRNGSDWTQLDSRQAVRVETQPTLQLRQSVNDPPVLVATDPATGRQHEILNPNPWLAQRELGRAEEYLWKGKDGHESDGVLFYPVGFRAAVRYPLVLQTHGYGMNFSLTGSGGVNFTAQALAGRGFVVLQVNDFVSFRPEGTQEWPAVRASLEGAIDNLDARGMIDRSKVGLQGYSRTGGYTTYMITHSRYPIAAAALTSTADYSIFQYSVQGPAAHGNFESVVGAKPFGKGLDVWQQHSPYFNLDKVKTPVFLLNEAELTFMWDWFAGLKGLGKPVEYWFLPTAAKATHTVAQQTHMDELLVDWWSFWLQCKSDPDPAKAGQFERWRQMRTQDTVTTCK